MPVMTITIAGRCMNDHEFVHRRTSEEPSDNDRCPCGARTIKMVMTSGNYVPDVNTTPRKSSREFQYNKKWNCPNIGRHVRSDIAQHRFNQKRVQDAKNRAAQRRRDRRRKPDELWEHIGRVPIEVHESVVENTNDRYAWNKDPVGLLKATGTYLGED